MLQAIQTAPDRFVMTRALRPPCCATPSCDAATLEQRTLTSKRGTAFSTGIAFGYRIGAVTRDRPDQPYVDVQVPSTCSPSTCSPSTCSPSTCSPSTCSPSTCSPSTLLQKVYRADWLRVETVCCRYRSRYCSCRRGVTQAQSNKYRSCARARQSVDVTEDAYAS